MDEYSLFRCLETFRKHSAYSSAQFILHCVKKFSYPIVRVQTDNGPEFTNRLISSKKDCPTLFERALTRLVEAMRSEK